MLDCGAWTLRGKRSAGATAFEFPAEDLRPVCWSSLFTDGIEVFWSGLPVSVEPDSLYLEPYLAEDDDDNDDE